MKPTLRIIKNNLFTIFVLFIFIIGMFILSYFKKIYWDNNNQAAYGSRIEDGSSYPITDDRKQEIIDKIKENEKVIDVTNRIDGRTIKYTITVTDDTLKADAKKIGNDIIPNYTEEELSYYTINVNIEKKDKTQTDFPIEGTRHHYSASQIETLKKEGKNPNELSWTKDREVATNETE